MAENLLSNSFPPGVFAKGLFSLVQCVSQFASSDSSGVVVVVARKSSGFMGDLLCVSFRKSKKNDFLCSFMQNRKPKKGPLNR